MRFLRDDRSQAIQIGAVLIFGILVVFLALYQGFVVPNQNEEIEFDHNQQLQSEMTDMRSAVISMPGRTTTQSVSLTLGVRYPSRALFVNPGPASGSVRTAGTTDEAINLTIENATADGAVGDFWDGTARSYNTGSIEYRPNYNLFATAPRTIYEHSVLYNDFGGETTLPVTEQAIVSGDRITLVTLNGSISESRVGDAAIDFEPVSTNTRTVEIYNESHPVTISVPTRLNESEWEDLFEEELTDGNVTAVKTTAIPSADGLSMLEIQLEPGTYSLQLAKVGVGTDITQTQSAYLTDIAGNGTTIQKGQTQTLELEVRDAFNNPLSGITVKGSAEKGVFTGPDAATVTKQTDENGQLTVEYEGVNPGANAINFSTEEGYDPVAGEPHAAGTTNNVTMTVTVNAPTGGGGGNGSAAFNVSWLDPSSEPGTGLNCDASSCTLNHTEAQQLALTVNTSATNAQVDFAVNDTGVATLDKYGASTDQKGEASVTLQPQANGTVSVYAWTGGSGDTINITIEDYDESLAPAGRAVFVKDSNGSIRLADADGVTNVGFTADVLGPPTTALDSDNLAKIPYVYNNELRLRDEKGNSDNVLVSSGGSIKPTKKKSLLAVGKWDGNPASIYFANNNQKKIYRHNGTTQDSAVEIANPGNNVKAVLGIADLTGDNTKELVFLDGSDELRYLNSQGGTPTAVGRGVGANNGLGVGRPADFNGNGEARIPIVSGSNNILLVDSTGNVETVLGDGSAIKAPIASVDWDNDGSLEIVYIDKSTGELKYIDDPTGAATVNPALQENPREKTGVT